MLSLFTPIKRSFSYFDDEDDFLTLFDKDIKKQFRGYTSDIDFRTYDKKNESIIEARLPENVDKDDVKVNVSTDKEGNKWINVVIEKEESSESEDGKSFRKSSSKVQRSFFFDEEVSNLKEMKATLKDGRMRIRIPKKHEDKEDKHKIEISIEE